jgi:chorismate synthase
MKAEIEKAKSEGDSVGGVLETAVIGLPAGVGEPWFDTLESVLAHGIFAIPAVKGLEFGAGFAMADMRGSEANDPFRLDGEYIETTSNNNGGILGGISSGMPIIFRTAIKPTPSIYKAQNTVDFVNMENRELVIHGRHDPAIVHRARVVVDSVTALILCDMLALRFGTDFLRNGN